MPGSQFLLLALLLSVQTVDPTQAMGTRVMAVAIALMVGSALYWRSRPRALKSAEPEFRTPDWLSALFPFTVLAAVTTLNTKVSILILGWRGDEQQVAAMELAQNVAMLVTLSLGVANVVIGPYVARAFQDQSRERLQRLARYSARVALLVALPLAIPLLFFSEPLVELVYGARYSTIVAMPLTILTVGQLINVGFGSTGLLLSMTGHERDTLLGQSVALVVTVVTAITLIPGHGATGAAIAVSMGLATWNILLAIQVVRKLRVRPMAI
ncbi:MAG: lipopolysaccharide biosynthesis protein [Pseudomonadota bacterium]